MSDEIHVSNEPAGAPGGAAGAASTAVLATIGAFGVAADRISATLERMSGDGPGVAAQARSAAGRAVRLPLDVTRSAARGVGRRVGHGWDATLGALNVPRRTDLDRLTEEVDRLSRKLDEMGGRDPA
jgi:hypothetical protein